MSKRHRIRGVVALVVALVLAACGPGGEVSSPTMPPPEEVTKDVPYIKPLHLDVSLKKLDVYAPTEPGPWPVVVFAHGRAEDKEDWVGRSQAIADEGAVVFTADWPTWTLEIAARDDGKGFREMSEALICAIRFARATALDYGGDPERMTLVGYSLGAFVGALVSLAGDDLDGLWEEFASVRGGPPPQIECLVNGVSAHVDAFVGVAGPYHRIEALRERDPDLWEIVSPYSYLGDNPDLRVRLIHGERDRVARVEGSVEFHEALADAGYDTGLTLFDGGHHLPLQVTIAQIREVGGD